MSDFFNEFKTVSKAEWEAQIIADLKGKDPSLLTTNDEIEEIEFTSYMHQEDINSFDESPGDFPFTRGMNRSDNDWKNGAYIKIEDAKTTNKKALTSLNLGADLLVFEAKNSSVDWKTVLDEVKLEYIQTQFILHNKKSFFEAHSVLSSKEGDIIYQLDFLGSEWSENDFHEISAEFNSKQQRFCAVNGFQLQQAGATTTQEIAFCLSAGHEYLVKLLYEGFTIDEACACVSFNIGIGANYFFEIAKIRALKQLWSKIIKAYNPEHNCSYNCHINARIGHLNKSIQDPHTNLLRQTTEAMSAVSGSVDTLTILPYDLLSSNGTTDLSERMAINISTILKEESYLDKVLDPTGGSYSVENLTLKIGRKAWTLFQKLESEAGIFNSSAQKLLVEQVATKRNQRIANFSSGKTVGIGMNKYKPTQPVEAHWKLPNDYLGLQPLVLEHELNLKTA